MNECDIFSTIHNNLLNNQKQIIFRHFIDSQPDKKNSNS